MPAEATVETIIELAPNLPARSAPRRLVFVRGTTAGASDFITVSDLTAVEGAFLIATDGTVGTMTFATNVITVTSAAKTYTGLAWGT